MMAQWKCQHGVVLSRPCSFCDSSAQYERTRLYEEKISRLERDRAELIEALREVCEPYSEADHRATIREARALLSRLEKDKP